MRCRTAGNRGYKCVSHITEERRQCKCPRVESLNLRGGETAVGDGILATGSI